LVFPRPGADYVAPGKNVIVFIYILALHNNEQIELVQFVS
jgi:hypothetical protein